MNTSLHMATSPPLAYALNLGASRRGCEEFVRRNHLQPVEAIDAAMQPLLLIIPEFDEEGNKLSLPELASAVIELAKPQDVFDLSHDVFPRLDGSAVFFNFGTPSAYSGPVASFICRHIEKLVEWVNDKLRYRIETALHEAIANAAVHGNLNIAGDEYDGENILEDRPILIAKAMEDRERAARRVSVMTAWDDAEIAVSVSDQGKGANLGEFAPTQWNEAPLCGMGLNLIAKAANSLSWEDGGRTVVMRFSR
jgi:anti-sigma regulatory factor (Ser/Thr protein kinase)